MHLPASTSHAAQPFLARSPEDAKAKAYNKTLALYNTYIRLGWIYQKIDDTRGRLFNPSSHGVMVDIDWVTPRLISQIILDEEDYSFSNFDFEAGKYVEVARHIRLVEYERQLSVWERLANSVEASVKIVGGIGICAGGAAASLGWGAVAACTYGADVTASGIRQDFGGEGRTLVNQAATSGLSHVVSPERAQSLADNAELSFNLMHGAYSAANIPSRLPPSELAFKSEPRLQSVAEPKPAPPAPPSATPASAVKQQGGQGLGMLRATDAPSPAVKVHATHPIFKGKLPANDPPVAPQSQTARVAANATADAPAARYIDPAHGTSDSSQGANQARASAGDPPSRPSKKDVNPAPQSHPEQNVQAPSPKTAGADTGVTATDPAQAQPVKATADKVPSGGGDKPEADPVKTGSAAPAKPLLTPEDLNKSVPQRKGITGAKRRLEPPEREMAKRVLSILERVRKGDADAMNELVTKLGLRPPKELTGDLSGWYEVDLLPGNPGGLNEMRLILRSKGGDFEVRLLQMHGKGLD